MLPAGEHLGGRGQSSGPEIFHRACVEQASDFPRERAAAHKQRFLDVLDGEGRVAHPLVDLLVQLVQELGVPLHKIEGACIRGRSVFLPDLLQPPPFLKHTFDAGLKVVKGERLLDVERRPALHTLDLGALRRNRGQYYYRNMRGFEIRAYLPAQLDSAHPLKRYVRQDQIDLVVLEQFQGLLRR